MPSDAERPGKGRKGRVQFRHNRSVRRRVKDWTDRTHEAEQAAKGERIAAKGDLSRRRTVTHHIDERPAEGLRRGVVLTVRGLYAEVDDGERVWPCTVRRILRTRRIDERNPVTVGDRVHFRPAETAPGVVQEGTIEHVEPRTGMIQRLAGRRAQTIAANVDQAIIVTSAADPFPKPHLIDRYIVAALYGGVQPIIVMNKIDLDQNRDRAGAEDQSRDHEGAEDQNRDREGAAPEGGGATVNASVGRTLPANQSPGRQPGDAPDQYHERERAGLDTDQGLQEGESTVDPAILPDQSTILDPSISRSLDPCLSAASILDRYRALGYPTVCTSAATGEGIAELRAILKNKSSAITGQSGVGKSSLLNAVQPGLDLRVGEVMEQSRKGRHTTTNAHLIRLEAGGYVVDTPGIRSFDVTIVPQGELEAYFDEFVDRVKDCKFANCTHTHEIGCAIKAAVESGEIHPDRYLTYIELFEEAAARRTQY